MCCWLRFPLPGAVPPQNVALGRVPRILMRSTPQRPQTQQTSRGTDIACRPPRLVHALRTGPRQSSDVAATVNYGGETTAESTTAAARSVGRQFPVDFLPTSAASIASPAFMTPFALARPQTQQDGRKRRSAGVYDSRTSAAVGGDVSRDTGATDALAGAARLSSSHPGTPSAAWLVDYDRARESLDSRRRHRPSSRHRLVSEAQSTAIAATLPYRSTSGDHGDDLDRPLRAAMTHDANVTHLPSPSSSNDAALPPPGFAAEVGWERDLHRQELDELWRRLQITKDKLLSANARIQQLSDEHLIYRQHATVSEVAAQEALSRCAIADACQAWRADAATQLARSWQHEARRRGAPRLAHHPAPKGANQPIRDSELLRALRRAELRVAELETVVRSSHATTGVRQVFVGVTVANRKHGVDDANEPHPHLRAVVDFRTLLADVVPSCGAPQHWCGGFAPILEVAS